MSNLHTSRPAKWHDIYSFIKCNINTNQFNPIERAILRSSCKMVLISLTIWAIISIRLAFASNEMKISILAWFQAIE